MLRDKRGTWHIRIQINEDQIQVRQSKIQLFDNPSNPEKLDGEFEFNLNISLDKEANKIESIKIEIQNVILEESIDPQTHEFWTDLFKRNEKIY